MFDAIDADNEFIPAAHASGDTERPSPVMVKGASPRFGGLGTSSATAKRRTHAWCRPIGAVVSGPRAVTGPAGYAGEGQEAQAARLCSYSWIKPSNTSTRCIEDSARLGLTSVSRKAGRGGRRSKLRCGRTVL
jgi:hypothetical protein